MLRLLLVKQDLVSSSFFVLMNLVKEFLSPWQDTMKKTERKKAVKAKIKEEFKSEKGYPGWVQSSDWPIGANGKPMTYVKKGKRDGSKHSWIFRDESNGEITVVKQFD